MKLRIENGGLRIAPSSIRDLRSSTSLYLFRHCALLHRLKRFAPLRRGFSNRIDGTHKILAFGLVKRFEQVEILEIEHVVDNDGIVERLFGKVPESLCRMLGNPFGPLFFTPSEDLLSKQQLFFFGNRSRIELVQLSADFLNKLCKLHLLSPGADRLLVLWASRAEAIAKKIDRGAPADKIRGAFIKRAGSFDV